MISQSVCISAYFLLRYAGYNAYCSLWLNSKQDDFPSKEQTNKQTKNVLTQYLMHSYQLILKKKPTVQIHGLNKCLSSNNLNLCLQKCIIHSFILFFEEEDVFLENILTEWMNQLLNSSYNEIYTHVYKVLQLLPRDTLLRFLLSAAWLVLYISSDGSITEGELLNVVKRNIAGFHVTFSGSCALQ